MPAIKHDDIVVRNSKVCVCMCVYVRTCVCVHVPRTCVSHMFECYEGVHKLCALNGCHDELQTPYIT